MKINDFLPQNGTGETLLAQGKVEKKLLQRTREKMKRNKIGWDEFMTAACKAYLAETEPAKK